MLKISLSIIVLALVLGVATITMARNKKGLLVVGASAPSLSGVDQMGRTHKLSDTLGSFTLVYFYPKDNTPGCTAEAVAFRDAWKKYEDAGVKLFGVSKGSVESHLDFANDQDLPFPLIADVDKTWGEAFGVRSFMGMFKRVSFLIDKKGKIAKVYDDVDPGAHAKQVLTDVGKLDKGK